MAQTYLNDIVDVELDSGTLHRSFISKSIGEGDNAANRFGIRAYRNKNAVSLTGTACIGYFIRPDGITLIITGTVSGNEAYVELPEAAYAREGQFTLAIKLAGTGYAGTVRVVDGVIINTTTGTINDPSSSIPSLSDYEDARDDIEAAAEVVEGITVEAEQITGTRYKISVTKE